MCIRDKYKNLLFSADSVAQFPNWFKNTFIIACVVCVISTAFVLMEMCIRDRDDSGKAGRITGAGDAAESDIATESDNAGGNGRYGIWEDTGWISHRD